MIVFILPFFVAMCLFGYVVFKEAKNLIELVKGDTGINKEYIIESMSYSLRDNCTDIQFEYFTELKNAIEVDNASEEIVASLVCKNYITDFYTWTNKQGQYDVGGLHYVYTPQKSLIYTQARDTFYKYINNYINDYGKDSLLEVESVNVNKSTSMNEYYYSDYEEFDNYFLVECTWTYKENSKFPTNNYSKKANFIVVKREGRFEIVEVSENAINVEIQEEETEVGTESE